LLRQRRPPLIGQLFGPMRVFAIAAAAALSLLLGGGARPASSNTPAAIGALSKPWPQGNDMTALLKYTSHAEIRSKFIPQDFSLDGDLTKPAWKKAAWRRFDHDMSGKVRYRDAETRVGILWSARFVYFAFHCHYTRLNTYEGEDPTKERWELWERDVVEVFANPEPARVNHYYEFEVAPNNQWIDLEIDKDKTPFNDAKWNSGFEHATRVDPAKHVWTCEMRIPVASMGVERLRAGAVWRANFFRADGRGGDSQRRFMSWSAIPEGKSFHVPTRFGRLRFGL
jgi:cellulose/xylan binding protein with CBM9 domain